jgi:hypothetical protein
VARLVPIVADGCARAAFVDASAQLGDLPFERHPSAALLLEGLIEAAEARIVLAKDRPLVRTRRGELRPLGPGRPRRDREAGDRGDPDTESEETCDENCHCGSRLHDTSGAAATSR